MSEGIRLQKVLANAGIASRRASEKMIDEGRVEVNGEIVTVQGMRVDPDHDVIRVDGLRIPAPRRHMYLALNKPKGVVSTMDDPEGRPALDQYVPRRERLFHVGRLDTDSEGLLFLTNDGQFAHDLAHPSSEVPKTYLVECEGLIENRDLKRLKKGIDLEDGFVRVDAVKLVSRAEARSLVRVTLHSGQNRVVRRMFDALGHPVRQLCRTNIGDVRLGKLAPGVTRELSDKELGSLLDIIEAHTKGKPRE